MGVVLHVVQDALAAQTLEYRLVHVPHGVPLQEAEPLHEDAGLVQGRDDRQAVHLAQLEVLGAGPRSDVDDARALALADILPGDDPVLHPGLNAELVEGAMVPEANQRLPRKLLQHRVLSPQCRHAPLGQNQRLVLLPNPDVRQVRVHRRRDVGAQRPRRRRPHQQRLLGAPRQGKAHEDPGVDDLLVSLGNNLVLGEPRAAAGAPGHHVAAFVQPAPLVAGLEKVPDRVVVLVGHRVVGVVPVHPIAQADGLGRLDGGEAAYTLLAQLHKAADAVGLDVPLGFEAQLPLHLHLNPQPLAVKAVLVALLEPLHRLVALVQVLVRSAPGMVDAHGVVGRDRPVDEGVAAVAGVVAVKVLLHHAGLVPPRQDVALPGREVDF